MYYILNETNQIIAADDNLLTLCGVSHINELSSKIIKNDIQLDLISNDAVTLKTENDEETFTITKTYLSSMLGQLTLVNIQTEEQETETSIEDNSMGTIDSSLYEAENLDEDDVLTTLNLDDTPITIDSATDAINDDIGIEESLSLDDDTMSLKSEPSSDESSEEAVHTHEILDDSELFDLVGESEKIEKNEDSKESITPETSEDDVLFIDTPKVADAPEISINVDEISEKIGISTDDYHGFLNEFIDTALDLEKDLQSTEVEVRSEAIGTLSHLSEVLHLPVLGESIDTIENANSLEQREVIESFYGILSRITTSAPEVEVEDKLELFEETQSVQEPIVQEKTTERKTPSTESFGTISLEGIKPKHFDFQLEEAANDLSLPVELIEEFVHDFIDQAHVETKKMLEAYEDGDFETIKKIGHLLKGASSNLRINALSDTLYKIQFCEDSNHLEPLIKDYWAHFLSFENQINVISN